ncbi:MAG: hypothetical protein ABI818_00725 [Acidobacteriota bacterium]
MDPRLRQILMRQQEAGFPDLEGTEGSIVLPISDRLLNEILASMVTLPAQVRELHVQSHAGNRIGVRVKVGGSFLPSINLTLVIEGQPELPGSPVLVLRLKPGGLLSMVAPALHLLDSLPSGITVIVDHVHVDLARLAEHRGLQAWFAHLVVVRVDTVEGSLILTLRAKIYGTRATTP